MGIELELNWEQMLRNGDSFYLHIIFLKTYCIYIYIACNVVLLVILLVCRLNCNATFCFIHLTGMNIILHNSCLLFTLQIGPCNYKYI